MAALLAQQEGKKQELDDLVADTSLHLKAARQQLADAQSNVAKYKQEIERQKAYEAELEAQKAKEDAKRLEEIRRQEEENKRNQIRREQNKVQSQNNGGKDQNPPAVKGDASDVSLLAALIQCEAGGESYEGKLAVFPGGKRKICVCAGARGKQQLYQRCSGGFRREYYYELPVF